MRIGDGAIAMMFYQARSAMNLRGGEILATVQRYQATAFQVGEAFQDFAALQAAEHIGERGPQLFGIDGVEDIPHLRVTRNVLEEVDVAKVIVGIEATFVES